MLKEWQKYEGSPVLLPDESNDVAFRELSRIDKERAKDKESLSVGEETINGLVKTTVGFIMHKILELEFGEEAESQYNQPEDFRKKLQVAVMNKAKEEGLYPEQVLEDVIDSALDKGMKEEAKEWTMSRRSWSKWHKHPKYNQRYSTSEKITPSMFERVWNKAIASVRRVMQKY